MNDWLKLLVGALIGMAVSGLVSFGAMRAQYSALDTRLVSLEESVGISDEVAALRAEVKALREDVGTVKDSLRRQWQLYGEVRNELDRREAVINRAESDFRDLDERLRKIEALTRWLETLERGRDLIKNYQANAQGRTER